MPRTLQLPSPSLALLIVVPVLLLAAGPAAAAVAPRSADLEGGTLGEFDQSHQVTGTLAVDDLRAYSGGRSARAQYAGGGANGYSRGIWNVRWADGDEAWFSAAFFLPSGFKAAMQGQVDLLRWDNWASHPNDTDWGGLVIYGSDRRMRLMRFNMANTGTTTLVGPFDVPEGRWVHLEVHQRLGAQQALSEVFLDGTLVGRSTLPNTYGRPIDRVRTGLVGIAAGRQLNPLTLWFDRAAVGVAPAGALGAPAPIPEPAPAPEPAPEPAPAPTSDGTSVPAEPAPQPSATPDAESQEPVKSKTRPKRCGRSRCARLAHKRKRASRRANRRGAEVRRRAHRAWTPAARVLPG